MAGILSSCETDSFTAAMYAVKAAVKSSLRVMHFFQAVHKEFVGDSGAGERVEGEDVCPGEGATGRRSAVTVVEHLKQRAKMLSRVFECLREPVLQNVFRPLGIRLFSWKIYCTNCIQILILKVASLLIKLALLIACQYEVSRPIKDRKASTGCIHNWI